MRARELRKAGNLSEVLLWLKLKGGQINGWGFDRQKIMMSRKTLKVSLRP
ncbi:MAG: DUF559 domain-containing protein [Synergistaceae bacterium]|nr:DUF559 domain-containing protein [Synergistaceae bacterium]